MVGARGDGAPLIAAALPGGALLAEAVWLAYSTGAWRVAGAGWLDTTVIVALVVAAVLVTRSAAGQGRTATALMLAGAIGMGGVAAYAAVRLAV